MQSIKRKLAGLVALATFLLTPGLALAADAVPQRNAWTPDIVTTAPSTWTGFYVGAGGGWEIQTLEDGESGFKVSDQAPLAYVRLGYRHELGGRIVVGAFVEGNASAMDIEDEISATYKALLGADAYFSLGNVLIGGEVGYKKAWLEAGSIEVPTEGWFAGPKIAVRLDGNIEIQGVYRFDVTEGEIFGDEVESTSGLALVGVAVRF